MRIRIENGRVLDPASGRDEIGTVWIQDGRIQAVVPAGQPKEPLGEQPEGRDMPAEIQEIDAAGCWVLPGLVDLHVHFRDPGFIYKETLATGARAAARGGFTAVCPMANTNPVVDTPERVAELLKRAETESVVRILPIGAVTKGLAGEELTDMAGMKAAGAVAFSEDGKTVMNAALYRKGLEQAAALDMVVMDHCEDANLLKESVMREGTPAEARRVSGVSHASEDVITARDILLARETGARLHLCHVSTGASARMAAQAKAEGVRLTAEVCPHHFTLTYEDIPQGDTNFKMAPPLREKEDVEALRQGLKTGALDVISTDHAPHSEEEKARPYPEAPNGIVGSETAVALAVTELVETGVLTPLELADRMSFRPAQILGLPYGTLREGSPADVTIVDPAAEYVIDKNQFASKGRNTPFHGRQVRGKVLYTIVDGKIVYAAEEEEHD